MIATSFHLI